MCRTLAATPFGEPSGACVKTVVWIVTGRVRRSALRSLARYMEIARLMMRARIRGRRAGIRASRTAVPIRPTRSIVVSLMIPVARMTWSRAVFGAM